MFVAVFIGIWAPTWRNESRFKTPGAVMALHLVNLLPKFVMGSYPSLDARPSLLRLVYLVVAVAVLITNSYVGLLRHDEV